MTDIKSAEQQVRKERDEIHAKYPHWALREVYKEIAVSKTAELMEMTAQRDEAQKALEIAQVAATGARDFKFSLATADVVICEQAERIKELENALGE